MKTPPLEFGVVPLSVTLAGVWRNYCRGAQEAHCVASHLCESNQLHVTLPMHAPPALDFPLVLSIIVQPHLQCTQ